jgi:hypothetical protein
MLIMAADRNELTGNEIRDNRSVGIAMVACRAHIYYGTAAAGTIRGEKRRRIVFRRGCPTARGIISRGIARKFL